jgi:succinate-semialdehyde dehydrogenase/glutarate-semialdehyde dehydrogenase
MKIQSINPATEEVIETFEPHAPTQIDDILSAVSAAQKRWRDRTLAERAEVLLQVAALLRERKDELARAATSEMGKPIVESEAEVEKCAWVCAYYAERAERFLADEPATSTATESYVAYRPLGVLLAIMPWNFPYWQAFRAAAPALMAGNAVVLKHASNVTRCALHIERLIMDSAADAIVRTIVAPGSEVEALIAEPRIAAVTLTGSDAAGVSVAGAAGHALKKTVLELGGSDAFVVLEDADVDAAAQMAVKARFQNTGQSCIAAKRFIVVEGVAGEFERKFVEAAAKLTVGDPLDRATQIGPLARADLRETLARQVKRSVAMGAQAPLGGQELAGPGGKGYYYAPTILTQVTDDMPVFREETFGPVAAVIRARDAEHAVQLANASDYGLGGNLWTRDLTRARELARRLESGGVFINGMTASDPRLPFGGVKRSGYGRELSLVGIREFVNIQTVWIGPAASAAGQAASQQSVTASVE